MAALSRIPALVDDTADSVTRAVVAGVPSSVSFARTLASAVLPGKRGALSFTASMTYGARTVTVTVASSQFEGAAISQIRYTSVWIPTAVPGGDVDRAGGRIERHAVGGRRLLRQRHVRRRRSDASQPIVGEDVRDRRAARRRHRGAVVDGIDHVGHQRDRAVGDDGQMAGPGRHGNQGGHRVRVHAGHGNHAEARNGGVDGASIRRHADAGGRVLLRPVGPSAPRSMIAAMRVRDRVDHDDVTSREEPRAVAGVDERGLDADVGPASIRRQGDRARQRARGRSCRRPPPRPCPRGRCCRPRRTRHRSMLKVTTPT